MSVRQIAVVVLTAGLACIAGCAGPHWTSDSKTVTAAEFKQLPFAQNTLNQPKYFYVGEWQGFHYAEWWAFRHKSWIEYQYSVRAPAKDLGNWVPPPVIQH